MISILTGALSLLGTGLKGFFGIKEKQADLINGAMAVVSDVNASDNARAVAAARIISAESRSESWIARSWRPLAAITFVILDLLVILGIIHVAPNVAEHLQIVSYGCIFGYMSLRTIDKLVKELSLGKVLKAFIESKVK